MNKTKKQDGKDKLGIIFICFKYPSKLKLEEKTCLLNNNFYLQKRSRITNEDLWHFVGKEIDFIQL